MLRGDILYSLFNMYDRYILVLSRPKTYSTNLFVFRFFFFSPVLEKILASLSARSVVPWVLNVRPASAQESGSIIDPRIIPPRSFSPQNPTNKIVLFPFLFFFRVWTARRDGQPVRGAAAVAAAHKPGVSEARERVSTSGTSKGLRKGALPYHNCTALVYAACCMLYAVHTTTTPRTLKTRSNNNNNQYKITTTAPADTYCRCGGVQFADR